MDQMTSIFPSAFDITPPKGAEDWQEMYPYYTLFQPKRRAAEDAKFWFCNNQHFPMPLRPFEAGMLEHSVKTLDQYNTRHLLVPPSNGVEIRILNGYTYVSPIAPDPSEIEARVPHFMERAGHYFGNWNDLLADWKVKVLASIKELDAIGFPALPEIEPLETVTGGKGLDSSTELFANFNKAMELLHRIWQYHFEFLNLGYAAYVDFFSFVKEQFPTIPDQAIAKMVQGVDSELFRPDDELKKLARLALDLGVADALMSGPVDKAVAAAGPEWSAAWETAKDPWFNFTAGNGFYSTDKYWIDHLDIPLGYVRDYIRALKDGKSIMRPTADLLKERDRIISEYREMMDPGVQEVFDQKLGLAQTVFPYVEDHNFYIEHWAFGVFWRKMRALSSMLSDQGFWPDADGMFFLKRTEVRDALWDYVNSWASGTLAPGIDYWPEVIEKRRGMIDALAGWAPQPALNNPPKEVTEPFTIMLWGVTTERVQSWASQDAGGRALSGMAASPGVVEGVARVLRNPDQLGELQKDEILVTAVTAPSWAPVFNKIGAAVTDIGGMMSHAAIVCREYGLPAVTGTGNASARIKTGMRLRVDGTAGTVEILD